MNIFTFTFILFFYLMNFLSDTKMEQILNPAFSAATYVYRAISFFFRNATFPSDSR